MLSIWLGHSGEIHQIISVNKACDFLLQGLATREMLEKMERSLIAYAISSLIELYCFNYATLDY